MIADYILNLAASFTQTLLTALATQLRGDPRRPAIERAYSAGFARWLETLRGELSDAEIGVVGEAFALLLGEADVANSLLDLALTGDQPDLAWLERRFGMVGGPAHLVNIRFDFGRQMTALQNCLITSLAAEASASGSPIFNQAALARLLSMHALLVDERRTSDEILAVVHGLEARNPGAVSNSAVVLLDIKRKFTERTAENLPPHLPSIQGIHIQHPQQAEVEAHLGTYGAVLLCGGPGTGKSGIAIDIARNAVSAGKNVLYIDARRIAQLTMPQDLRRFVDLDMSVTEAFAQLAVVEGCMLIIDQLDSVAGTQTIRLLRDLAIGTARSKGTQVLVVTRDSEDNRSTVSEFAQSGFQSIQIRPLPRETAQSALIELGISNPHAALITLAATPLNLDLIARVCSMTPSVDLESIDTELALWREFFNRVEEQESTLENLDAGRRLRSEAVALARQCLSTPDRTTTLPINSARTQRLLIDWEILQRDRPDSRIYRFRHEQLQDYLVAEDAFATRLTAEQLLVEIDPHKLVGVAAWLAKLYVQSDPQDQVRFLKGCLVNDGPLPFYSQVTLLSEYLHRDVSDESAEVIGTILDAVQTVPGMREFFFDAHPHPSWAKHLWNHGFYASPPPPRVDAQGRKWPIHWDAQRYLISVAGQVSHVVMQHAMTIDGDGWYIGWALDAVCSIPPAEALPVVERIVNLFGDPVIADSIEHAAYQLMMHFAQAGEQDAAFAIFSAMTAPRFPPPEQAANMRMGPEGLVLQSDHYELFTNEIPQLAQLDCERLVGALDYSLRALVSFNTPPSSYVARNPFWRSAIEETDQDRNNSAAGKLLVALRKSLGMWLESGSATARSRVLTLLEDEYGIFRRLALHLVAYAPEIFPDELADLLLDQKNFDDSFIHHEFFQLLRLGFPYLSDSCQKQVVHTIRKGLSDSQRQKALDWLRKNPAHEPAVELSGYQNRWIRDRLLMIRDYLRGDDAELLRDLIGRFGEPERPDFLAWHSAASWVQQVSPVSPEQILRMSQDELVAYVRNWTPPARTSVFQDESRSGLASAIAQALLADASNRQETILAVAASDSLVASSFLKRLANENDQPAVPWELSVLLCEQVASWRVQATAQETDLDPQQTETCMDALRLLERGLEQDNELPEQYGTRVRSILLAQARDPDPSPTDDEPDNGTFAHNDPLTLSLNHVRPRVIALLIRYALQLAHDDREQRTSSQIADGSAASLLDDQLRALLTAKLDAEQEPSWAVRSVFGQLLPALYWLDPLWTTQNLDRIFPESDNQADIRMFIAAWDGYVVSGRYYPSPDLLVLLRPKYLRAIDNLADGRVTQGLDPARKLAEHVIWEYLHNTYDPTAEPNSTNLAVVFFQKAPLDARGHAAWAAWQACTQNPQDSWPRIRLLWEWRVACAAASSRLQDFAAEMACFAQIPDAVRGFVALPSISSLLQTTLKCSLLSDQRGSEWNAVEEFLDYRVRYEPVDVVIFMSWLIDVAPNPQHTKSIKTRRNILEALASKEQTRVAALDLIDQLGRRGIHGYRDIYERYA